VDFGIRGRTALVCAASKGLGKGCAMALAREGVNLVITARGAEALEATADEIRKSTGVQVTSVAGDITAGEGRAAALKACPAPDILVNNAGGPPPGDFRNWTRDDWLKALEANMLAPIELIKAVIDPMLARRFGRIVNITSSAVKAPIDVLGLSNGARSGLTGFVAGLARQSRLASRNVTINNLLPGFFDTDRIRSTLAATATKSGKSIEEVMDTRRATIPARRLGTAQEFGAACAFLCSAQAGYITGQNWLLDGGGYPGTF
jgi:3-oxoacyl-[acyl-carrier protein] reductase